ncbi:MAG: hypothetical protein Q9228_007445 [Teloschistes exilis]
MEHLKNSFASMGFQHNEQRSPTKTSSPTKPLSPTAPSPKPDMARLNPYHPQPLLPSALEDINEASQQWESERASSVSDDDKRRHLIDPPPPPPPSPPSDGPRQSLHRTAKRRESVMNIVDLSQLTGKSMKMVAEALKHIDTNTLIIQDRVEDMRADFVVALSTFQEKQEATEFAMGNVASKNDISQLSAQLTAQIADLAKQIQQMQQTQQMQEKGKEKTTPAHQIAPNHPQHPYAAAANTSGPPPSIRSTHNFLPLRPDRPITYQPPQRREHNEAKRYDHAERDNFGTHLRNDEDRGRSTDRSMAFRRERSITRAMPYEDRDRRDEFRTADIGYFHPNLPVDKEHPEGEFLASGKDIFYRDVVQFVQQVRRVAHTKNVASRLHLCLRGTALPWFTNLPSDIQDQMSCNVDVFCDRITAKYQISTSRAFDLLHAEKYTMQDAKKNRPADDYVQSMIRYGKHCGQSDLSVLTLAWKHLDEELQRDVTRPYTTTTSDELARAIDEAAEYWSTRNRLKATSDRTHYPNNDATEAAFQRGVQSGERRANNPGGYQQTGGRNERNQVLPPSGTSGQFPARPQAAQGQSGQLVRTQNRFGSQLSSNQHAYFASEDTPDQSNGAAEVYWNDTPSYDMSTDLPGFSCGIHGRRYGDYDGLADHLINQHGLDLGKQQQHNMHQINMFSPGDEGYVCVKGQVIGGTARKGGRKREICTDTGTGISAIDHELAIHTLGLKAMKTKSARICGIGSGIVNKYVTFQVKLEGSDKVLDITAYLYKGLNAGIILGNNSMKKHGIDVLLTKEVIMMDGVEIPFNYKKASDGVSANHIAVSPIPTLRTCLKAKITSAVNVIKSVAFAPQVQCKEFNTESIIRCGQSDASSTKSAHVSITPASSPSHAATSATSRANHLRSLPSWRLCQRRSNNVIGHNVGKPAAHAEKSLEKTKWQNM